MRVAETRTLRELASLYNGTTVYTVAFSPDGTRLAVGCKDNTIRLWDLKSYQQVAELRGHTDYVHAVAFSPDGTQLVSGSGDSTVPYGTPCRTNGPAWPRRPPIPEVLRPIGKINEKNYLEPASNANSLP